MRNAHTAETGGPGKVSQIGGAEPELEHVHPLDFEA